MSYIERHPKRRAWRVRWRVGGRGTPQKASEWFTEKDKAELCQATMDGRKKAEKPASGRALMSLSEIVSRWVLRVSEKRNRRYVEEAAARLLALFAARKWTHVSDIVDTDTLKVGVFRNVRTVMRFAHLRLGQPLPSLVPPDPPKRKPVVDLLTPQRVRELIAAATEWSPGAGALVHMVAVYGHRPESLVHRTCAALKGGKFRLPVKSGDEIEHPLTAETIALLSKMIEGRKKKDPMFLNPEGEPWEDGHDFSMWFFHRIGAHKLGIYQLKRYALTRMLSVGLDVATIASITGHRTPLTILKYARTNQDRQQSAVKAIEGLGAP